MKEEKPEYGWYVKDLIVIFTTIGVIGLSLFIIGLFLEGILRIILLISGSAVILLFLWPGIGMTVLNLTLSDDFNIERAMPALQEIKIPQILDIGCGTGRTAIQIAKALKNGGHLTGIDIYEKMAISGNALETVNKNAKLEGVDDRTTFQYGSATEIPFDDEKFDIVNVSSVLHELHDEKGKDKAIDEIYRVLKSGGYLYMSEWNRKHWKLVAFMGIFCFVFKNSDYWKKLLLKHNFNIEKYVQRDGFGIFIARKL